MQERGIRNKMGGKGTFTSSETVKMHGVVCTR